MADEKIERKKAVDLAMSQIDRQFGKGSIMWLGDNKSLSSFWDASVGSASLHCVLTVTVDLPLCGKIKIGEGEL